MKQELERLRRIRANILEALDTMDFGDATAAVEYAEEHIGTAIEALTEVKTEEDEHA